MAELIIKRPGEPLQRRPLPEQEAVIGRDPSCDVVLNSSFVSRQHARLQRSGEAYELVDAGSRNGVLVNGKRLERRHVLQKGDEIEIAEFLLTFWEPSAEESTRVLEDLRSDLLHVDRDSKEVWLGPRRLELRLSAQEFALLSFLYESAGKTRTGQEIGDHIWGVEEVGGRRIARYDDNMVHRLVYRLKAKLKQHIDPDSYVVNIPGMGYRLDKQPRVSST